MLRRASCPLFSRGTLERIPFLSVRLNSSRIFTFSSSPGDPSSIPAPPPHKGRDVEPQDSRPTGEISIDRSGLFNPAQHSHEASSDSQLVKHLKSIIKGTSKFKTFTRSLHIHLVECSPTLQKLQYKALKCVGERDTKDSDTKSFVSTLAGACVSWHTMLDQVPSGLPTIIIAHEFYDSLPVHQFQKASRGWCEKMVDVAEDSTFRFVLSPQPTPAILLYLMKRFKWAGTEEIAKLEHIEVCPRAMELTRAISKRLGSDGGGALIIDYGRNGIVSDSLQAIRRHKFVGILDDPGSADLSAYVDFTAIRHSAEEASDNVSVHGPISQSQFLGSLGINFRVEALLQNCTDEQAESLRTGYWRLVGDGEAPFWDGPDEQTPIGMGTRYQVLAIVNKKQGAPVPFE